MAAILYQASMREGTFPKPRRRSRRARSSNMICDRVVAAGACGTGRATCRRHGPASARGRYSRRRPRAVRGLGARRLRSARRRRRSSSCCIPAASASRYYGAEFTRRVVEPALRQLKADHDRARLPDRDWSDAAADKPVMTLIDDAMRALQHRSQARARRRLQHGRPRHVVHGVAAPGAVHGRDPDGRIDARPDDRSARPAADLHDSQPRRRSRALRTRGRDRARSQETRPRRSSSRRSTISRTSTW